MNMNDEVECVPIHYGDRYWAQDEKGLWYIETHHGQTQYMITWSYLTALRQGMKLIFGD